MFFSYYKFQFSDGGGIHDVIGTRCDPFTHALMSGGKTPVYTCHQNLANALDEFLNKLKMDELVQHSFVSSDLGSVDLVKPLRSLINIYLSTKFYHALFVCII